MREAAVAVAEAGLEPWSASATAERQTWMSSLAEAGIFGARDDAAFARSPDWRTEADRILEHLGAQMGGAAGAAAESATGTRRG